MTVNPSQLESVVADLCDKMKWNWTRMVSLEAASDVALTAFNRAGLIEYAPHRLGGHVWKVNGRFYGRTDGVDAETFAEWQRQSA